MKSTMRKRKQDDLKKRDEQNEQTRREPRRRKRQRVAGRNKLASARHVSKPKSKSDTGSCARNPVVRKLEEDAVVVTSSSESSLKLAKPNFLDVTMDKPVSTQPRTSKPDECFIGMPIDEQESVSSMASDDEMAVKRPKARPYSRIRIAFLLATVFAFLLLLTWFAAGPVISDANAYYVPGGGFSGFWYALGRFHKLRDNFDNSYYCYSSGCLVTVASLRKMDKDALYASAHDIQRRWLSGEICRYQVVPTFVNALLHTTSVESESELVAILSRLHIITARREGFFGMKTAIQTPTTIQELRELLIQTTWIPFVTGETLWKDGHMDGAFSMLGHPTYANKLAAPHSSTMLLHTLNFYLSRDKVNELWNAGRELVAHDMTISLQ